MSGGCRNSRNPPSESARLANGKYHRPFGVVSKCALREKKEEGPRFPGDLPSEI